MRTRTIGFGGALAFAFAIPLAAPAAAAPAHCFDMFGAAIGPSYETDALNSHWVNWVHARGGSCRTLQYDEAVYFSRRPLGYPAEYLATVAPAAPPSIAVQPAPPATSAWAGDSARAAELVTVAYAERGRPATVVSDSGRAVFRADGVWRIYDVTWRDGYRRQVAVLLRPDRGYYAIEADDGENWSAAVYLGR